jgi:hypothetical protein
MSRESEIAADQTGLRTAGLRRVNLIWERTQSMIALSVVLTTCLGVAALSLLRYYHADVILPTFPPEWWTIVGLVIGFYFGRTNHDRGTTVERNQ